MNHLEDYEVDYHCFECGWTGWIKMENIVKCPKCGNINDIWKEGDPEPERHRIMNKKILKFENF